MKKLFFAFLLVFGVLLWAAGLAEGWYEISDDGTVLSILSNTESYGSAEELPWAEKLGTIRRVAVSEGVTSIGDCVLSGLAENTRIDFYTAQQPELSASAMAGTKNLVCRYYAQGTSWGQAACGGEGISWMYLPAADAANDGVLDLEYTTEGWKVYTDNGASMTSVTVEQALEMAWGNRKAVGFMTALPSGEDAKVYEGWKDVSHITARSGFTGTLEAQLDADSALQYVAVEFGSTGTLSISDPREEGLYRMDIMGGGSVAYTGNVRSVILRGGPEQVCSVTIEGDVTSADFYNENTDCPFLGDFTVTGTAGKVHVHGKSTIDIPGVGETEIAGISEAVLSSVKQAEPVIQAGKVNVADYTPVTATLEMFTLDYSLGSHGGTGNEKSLVLYPKQDYTSVVGEYAVNVEMPDSFALEDIAWGPDTSVMVNTTPEEGIVLPGKTDESGEILGLGRLDVHSGKVTVKCPVGHLGMYTAHHEKSRSEVTVEGAVDLLVISDAGRSDITLGEKGTVKQGQWNRGVLPTRYFGTESGSLELYTKGTLNVMSRKSGEEMYAQLPPQEDLDSKAGTDGEDTVACMDIGESSLKALSEDESAALTEYLEEAGLSEDAVEEVVDISVVECAYDEDGQMSVTGSITSLSGEVDIAVSNPADTTEVEVVRLHAEESGVSAQSVKAEAGEDKIEFPSDKFSKYIILDKTKAVTAKNIAACTIAKVEDQTATGSALTPALTIKDGDTALVSGTDYIAEYSDNVSAGTATVKVTGMGKYTGTATVNFTIVAADEPVPPEEEKEEEPEDTGKKIPLGKTGWVQNSDRSWSYGDADGNAVTGPMKIGGVLYVFDEKGIMATGWAQAGGKWYYAEASGAVVCGGWNYINNAWYYFKADGEMATGWINDGGTWYYMQSSGAMATGWVNDGGKWYYLEDNGAMKSSGWMEYGSDWYYLQSSGEMATGWIQDGGQWYYMDSSGAMATGWAQDAGKWYKFAESGAMQTGWVSEGGTSYYLQSSGAMATGWAQDAGKWYYFDTSGAMQKGWNEIGGKWYYCKEDGTMVTGWAWIDGGQYYFGSSGAMSDKWTKISSQWYYFRDGKMVKGWFEDKEAEEKLPANKKQEMWYWFDNTGVMATGWKEIEGKWQMFDESTGLWLYTWSDE